MGFISRLKRLLVGSETIIPAETSPDSPKPQPKNDRATRNAVVRDGWLTLTQPAFFGQAHRSSNKRWIVGCNDSDGVSRGGYRESGNGRVVLVDHQMDKVMHELRHFARPMDAAVADAGTYIVLDSGFGVLRRNPRKFRHSTL